MGLERENFSPNLASLGPSFAAHGRKKGEPRPISGRTWAKKENLGSDLVVLGRKCHAQTAGATTPLVVLRPIFTLRSFFSTSLRPKLSLFIWLPLPRLHYQPLGLHILHLSHLDPRSRCQATHTSQNPSLWPANGPRSKNQPSQHQD